MWPGTRSNIYLCVGIRTRWRAGISRPDTDSLATSSRSSSCSQRINLHGRCHVVLEIGARQDWQVDGEVMCNEAISGPHTPSEMGSIPTGGTPMSLAGIHTSFITRPNAPSPRFIPYVYGYIYRKIGEMHRRTGYEYTRSAREDQPERSVFQAADISRALQPIRAFLCKSAHTQRGPPLLGRRIEMAVYHQQLPIQPCATSE